MSTLMRPPYLFSRLALVLLPVLALFVVQTPAAAAPGLATPIGPFVVLGDDHSFGLIEQLVFPKPGRILARTSSGLYRSDDGGLSWRSLLPLGLPLRLVRVELDYADPERYFVFSDRVGARMVLETRDGGSNWSFLSLPEAAPESRLVGFFADAQVSGTLVTEWNNSVAGTQHFFSRNGGQSWSPLVSPFSIQQLQGVNRGVAFFEGQKVDLETGAWTELSDFQFSNIAWLEFDRTRADTLYISTSRSNLRFARSENGGQSFEVGSNAAPISGFSQSPSNPSYLAGRSWASRQLTLSADRGRTWTPEALIAEQTAFDPESGEIVATALPDLDKRVRHLVRRRADGSKVQLVTNGLPEAYVKMVWAQGGRTFSLTDTFNVLDAEGQWQRLGKVADGDRICGGPAELASNPADPDSLVLVCQDPRIFYSRDGGLTWRYGGIGNGLWDDLYPPNLGLAQQGGNTWLYAHFRTIFLPGAPLYRSADFGATWENLGESLLDVVVHPDAARGVVAIHENGSLRRYLPATGWQTIPTDRNFGPNELAFWDSGLGHDPAHPELIYAVVRGSFLRSLDFGTTWQQISGFDTAFAALFPPAPTFNPVAEVGSLVIDPFDANHWLLPYQGYETRDGGVTFIHTSPVTNGVAAFDRARPGRFLAGTNSDGVLESTAELAPCSNSDKTWCARGGRFQLTVDWKSPSGSRGRAVQVATGSEDSGLFYFFDANNWELLVKVLDGCAINQRFWLLSAGTTDVAYTLQVEDRWTGQIRHYANAAGQAAPAVIDTDAFSGCSTVPPPGAATVGAAAPMAGIVPKGGEETSISLLGGQFEVAVEWTDFVGAQGPGRAVPLRSDNSGLFYFFTPDNWEMLVKVLNGCAINGHYWVLAAATTNVGYELEVKEPGPTGRRQTYTNPVGRAAPALLDLNAFSCPASASPQ